MQHKTERPLSKRVVILAVLAALLLVCAGFFCAAMLFAPQPENGAEQNTGVVLDKNAVAFTNDALEASEAHEQLSIRFPVYPEITIEKDKSYIPIVLANPAGNPCYFTFHVSVKESGDVLYTSGLVEPGMAIERIELEKTLEPGDYTLVIDIGTSALEDQTQMNGGSVETALHVTE